MGDFTFKSLEEKIQETKAWMIKQGIPLDERVQILESLLKSESAEHESDLDGQALWDNSFSE